MTLPSPYTSAVLPGSDDISSLAGGYLRPGAVWGSRFDNRAENAVDRSIINVLCDVSRVVSPNSFRAWSLDGVEGGILTPDGASYHTGPWSAYYADTLGADASTMLAVEPLPGNGIAFLWIFGEAVDTANGGPTMLATAGPPALDLSGTFGVEGYAADFGIDTANDRVWIRGSEENVSKVRVYRTSGTYLHTISAPNATHGIIPTGEGRVWLVDEYGWIFLYDYDGVKHAGFRNPPAHSPLAGGWCYGWDPVGKRLLRLEATPEGGGEIHGSSVVEGFWPVPDPAGMTNGISREDPRKGRTIYWFANVYEEGGAGVSSRLVNSDGTSVLSDAEGDIVKRVDLADAGVYTKSIEGPMGLSSSVSFNVADAEEVSAELPEVIQPPAGVGDPDATGQLIHPDLGVLVFVNAPEAQVGLDGDLVRLHDWVLTKTIGSGAATLWRGDVRDVKITLTWHQTDVGCSLDHLRALQTYRANPVDPEDGFIIFAPDWCTPQRFRVAILDVRSGGGGYTVDNRLKGLTSDEAPNGYAPGPVEMDLGVLGLAP